MTTVTEIPHGFYSEWHFDPFLEVRTIPSKWDLSSIPENSFPGEEIQPAKIASVVPGAGSEHKISFSTWQFDSFLDDDPWLERFYWSAL